MPEKETLERAAKDKRQGKAPSTQAGEFIREEFHHVREGKHGVRNTKQAIAIGLSKARRAGVKLPTRNSQDAREEALPWLERNGNPYQLIAYDRDGRIGIDYGVYGVPETYVIDAKGVIRYKHIGPLSPDVVRDKLEPLVKELANK